MASNKQVIIEPSILSANFVYLGKGVAEAQEAGAKGIQIDIMDGQFVPNISFGWDTVAAIRPLTDMFLDVHLMIVQPERYQSYTVVNYSSIKSPDVTCNEVHLYNRNDDPSCIVLDRVLFFHHANSVKAFICRNRSRPG